MFIYILGRKTCFFVVLPVHAARIPISHPGSRIYGQPVVQNPKICDKQMEKPEATICCLCVLAPRSPKHTIKYELLMPSSLTCTIKYELLVSLSPKYTIKCELLSIYIYTSICCALATGIYIYICQKLGFYRAFGPQGCQKLVFYRAFGPQGHTRAEGRVLIF